MKINNQSRFRQDWFRFESVRGPRYEARGTRPAVRGPRYEARGTRPAVRGPRYEGIPDNSAGRVRRLAIVKRYGVPGSNPGPGTNKKVIKR